MKKLFYIAFLFHSFCFSQFPALDLLIEQQKDGIPLVSDLVRLGEKKGFPIAMGHADYVTGNETGNVYTVTSLNSDIVTGTLPFAKTLGDNITIQFNVSGIIDMNDTDMTFRGNNLTFAFETAPSPGITIKGGAPIIRGSNVVIRHMVSREGFSTNTAVRSPFKAGPDNTSGNISGLILDHCTLGWTMDQNFSIGGSSNAFTNITLQNSLIHEAIEFYATIIGNDTKNVSMIRNFFHSNQNRIPESPNGQFRPSWEFLNNLVYNYDRASTAAFGSRADVVNNVYHAGSSPPQRGNLSYQGEFLPNGATDTRLPASEGRVHDSGNIQLGSNSFGMYDQQWDNERVAGRGVASSYEPIPANEVVSTIFDEVGAITFPDTVRDRLKTEYNNNQGNRTLTNESDVGGFPSVASNAHPSGYYTTEQRTSQEFKNTHQFIDDMAKPVSFTINNISFDNKEYTGGTYVNDNGTPSDPTDDFTQNEYIGGTWTGEYIYTWWDIFRHEKAGDFKTENWQN